VKSGMTAAWDKNGARHALTLLQVPLLACCCTPFLTCLASSSVSGFGSTVGAQSPKRTIDLKSNLRFCLHFGHQNVVTMLTVSVLYVHLLGSVQVKQCQVVQVKTLAHDGYNALQVAIP